MKKYLNKAQRQEQGIVLVAVLISVSILFIICSIVMAQSRLTTLQSKNSQFRSKQRYDNESQQSHILFQAYLDRKFRGQNAQDSEEEPDPFISNAKQRFVETEDSNIHYKIKDAMVGYPLWDRRRLARIKNDFKEQFEEEDPAIADEFELWSKKLLDYQDRDENEQANGGDEGDGYDEPNLLPRNASIQFIEELLWIPQENEDFYLLDKIGLSLSYPGQIDEVIQLPTTIARSKTLRSNFTKPSFLSSTLEMIQRRASLDESQIETVKEARQAWYEERTPWQQSLGELYSPLSTYFNFKANSSYVYTIVQEARNRDMLSPIILRSTVHINNILKTSDAEAGYIRYIRRVQY